MMISSFVEDFLEVAIPGAILLGILYGIWMLVKYGYKKIVAKYGQKYNSEGNREGFSYEQKKTLLDMIKVFLIAQVIGVLFYVTPTINENVKILVSLIVTLATFVGTFFIKEKKGYNGLCRVLIFIGQEFFGITMFLMMVNKGMTYTVNTIFAIWTLFNLYISKEFGKIENKLFFWGTFIILICSMISTYANEMEAYVLVISMCILLLGIYFFADKSKMSVKLFDNVLITLLAIVVVTAVYNLVENQVVIFATTVIYMIAVVSTLVVLKRFNFYTLFTFLPYAILIFLIDLEEFEIAPLLSIFNVTFVIWVLSEKSIYKKLLCAMMLCFTISAVIENSVIDELLALIIYGSSIIFVFTYLFAPKCPNSLMKGEEENEE